MTIKQLKSIVQKEKFHPTILSFFINNNFLIRKSIRKAIIKNSKHLKGALLDFGCGTKPYKKLFLNVDNYIGVDYKIEGREESQKTVDFFYDGKVIPFKNQEFDSILSTEVLEHVFNIEEILSELNRVLKINGHALITTPFMWEEHEMPYDFARYTTPALEYLYQKHGFEIIHNHKTGNQIEVIFQFAINYFKNIIPKFALKQLLLVPFIFVFNVLGMIFSFILPTDKTAYFNNVFVLKKINNLD
ncbi:class I SAM-dependent methyltransferase [Flavobacterium sp.]|jgi:ubiquinone/menaquinone biosynthesis C-methylase UbiE|uniref:class I SAM-dependent methyltransferase n=1 Tax=Flavobacterium sp. TaxID=239 RepID=UPI0037BE3378